MENRFLIIILLISLLFIPSSSCFAEIFLISNPNVPINEVTKNQIKDIYLGNIAKWEDGSKIIFAVMFKTDIHKQFTREFTHKSTSQFKRFWKYKMFVGEGRMPVSFKNSTDLVIFISKTSGSIAYINQNPSNDHVKILKVK